jgi:DNA-binding GntR family transcriptional regulator
MVKAAHGSNWGFELGTKTDAQAARLVEAIKSDIIIGRLHPREHLVEDEIASKSETSRHVVRAALVMLERMGLIIRRPNRGAIVRDFSPDQVNQIYDVRIVLQAEAARLVPCPASTETLSDLETIHADYTRALNDRDLLRVNALNDAFHRRIWATCPNHYLADLIERLWIETTGIRWYGVGDVNLLAHSLKDHQRMMNQLRRGDRAGFVDLAVKHILPPLEAFKRVHSLGASQAAEGRATDPSKRAKHGADL